MDCTVIGDVFFDIVIRSSPSGLKIVRGGTSYINQITQEPGGVGNIAVGLSRIGGKAQLIGKAGADNLGRLYHDNLVEECVKPKLVFDQNHPTGILLNFVESNGERSFLISRGANDFLLPEEVQEYEGDITSSRFVFVSGFSLFRCPQREAILKAVEIAKNSNVQVVFDPGAYNLVAKEKPLFEKLLCLCDTIILNLAEARALTGLGTISDVARHLSKKVPLVALKMGKKGCLIITQGKKYPCLGNRVISVDSTGAGDAFASALIYGLKEHFSAESLAKFATWYSSCVVQSWGPRSFPSPERIKNYLDALLIRQ